MLAIIFSWIVISFVLLSIGDLSIFLYNKLCNKNEWYNVPETFMLGMCFILIPLSFSSLWLPSNQYTLLFFFAISIVYCILNKVHIKYRLKRIKETIRSISTTQKILITLALCSILLYMLYCTIWPDALYYHYQQIRWNEEHAIIPGLANLEDRFGFNSNYLLLSAIFTFRFLFGEPIYTLQSTLFIYVTLWVLNEVIKSGFQFSRLILLCIFLFFFSLNIDFLADSSTDIIPNICTFYFIARFTLYPDTLDKKSLFAFLLPITLCTFKMSVFPLCLISIYILFYTIKNNRKPTLYFLIASAFCITVLWLIRNVIISGYLVYPLYELDFFSFDWKLPEGIAKIQREIAISSFAKGIFKDCITFYFFERSGYLTFKLFLIKNIIITLFYAIIAISPFILCYNFLQKRKTHKSFSNQQLILYISLLASFLYWLLSAPDVRFASGIICGTTLFILNTFFYKKITSYPKLGTILFFGAISIMLILSVNRANRYHKWMVEFKDSIKPYNKSNLLIKPFSAKDQMLIDSPTDSSEYQTNGITIYLTKDGNSYGKLPRTKDISPAIVAPASKLQNAKTVEARGKTLEDGFRTKKEYISIIDSISEEHIKREKTAWW